MPFCALKHIEMDHPNALATRYAPTYLTSALAGNELQLEIIQIESYGSFKCCLVPPKGGLPKTVQLRDAG